MPENKTQMNSQAAIQIPGPRKTPERNGNQLGLTIAAPVSAPALPSVAGSLGFLSWKLEAIEEWLPEEIVECCWNEGHVCPLKPLPTPLAKEDPSEISSQKNY